MKLVSIQVITDINQLAPHMKEKLRLQLAKLTPGQLDYFLKNQATILAKLVKQHEEMIQKQQLLQQQAAAGTAVEQPQSLPTQPAATPASVQVM